VGRSVAGSNERTELSFVFLEGGECVGVAVHVAGPSFRACSVEFGKVGRVEGVSARCGARPHGVAI